MSDQKKRVEELQERHQGMRKKVNPKVLDMIDACASPVSATRFCR